MTEKINTHEKEEEKKEAVPEKPRERRQKTTETVNRKRAIAKNGMTASLAALFATGFYREGYDWKKLHIASGFALAGFSLWHYTLYTKR